MAAGDIILSDGTTITPEDLQKIAAETKKILAAESKELSQYEEVSSLSNLTSLPGIFQSGSTMKLVRVALSVLKGIDGKTVELSASSTAIQWRYVGESEWNTLIDIALLKGDKGDAGEKVVLRKGESGIEWKYESEEDTAYKALVSMDDIKLKYSDLSEADKAELTKKPILATVNAQSGSTPSGSFASDGEDENGNPKYILNLTVQKGDKGEPPVFEVGSVTTGLPSSEASVELTPNGETPEGNPKYIMDISIPKGEPGQNGEGSGNVYATETGLEAGKTYLFRPSAPNSASGTFVLYEAPDTSNFVTSEKLTEELEKKQDSGDYILDAPSDDKQYARKNGEWEEVKAGDTVTKESIENVFTGNIESHTHNSTYEYTEFGTDVWDGSTISESLQGAGTKDDPYLIQSCADWIYFWNNSDTLVSTEGVDNPTGLLYFIKLVKSLDFNNLPVSYLEQSKTGLCDVDGCGATISNFIIDDKETGNGCEGNRYGIANTPGFCYFHDFNLVNITIKKTLNVTTSGNSSLGLGFFTVGESEALMGLHANNYIQGKIVLSGSISVNTTAAILEAGIGMYLFSYAPELVKNILKDKNMYFGSSITIEDNTVKTNGSKLTIQRTVVSDYNSLIGGTGSFIGYDNSISTLTGVTENEPVFEGDTENFLIFMGRDYSNIFVCSEKSNGFLVMNESPVFIDSLRKTLEELNSDSFINTTLNSLELVFRKGTETPVLAPKNAKLKYDGYVRQSEFEDFKAKINLSPVNPESPFVDIEFTASVFPEHNSTVELTQEQYDIIHKELINGKILRINAMCGIFFGTSNLFIGDASGSDLDKEEYQKSAECFVNILVGDIDAIVNADSNISEGVTNKLFTVKISKTANETGKHIATFYKAKDLVSSDEVRIIKKLTQSEYDALGIKDAATLYIIIG